MICNLLIFNMVFYRKYRPQKIEELDSMSVRETLRSVLQNPAHAFLFTGPKGLGKTSTARIIAKIVNCTSKKKDSDVEPCNKCEQCESINNGTNMDILEIDAASNRGIDEIRDLKEKIRLSPLSARIKAYIIDEVHMLTTEAFNALLKTLEEPPAHAMFILCTTEPQKVPATIVSRCLHLSFKKATGEELMRAFQRIVKLEKIAIDKAALSYIAGISDGSFRDGTKILEEVTLLANGKQITKKLVEDKYQISNIKYQISSLFESLNKNDIKKGLKIVNEVSGQGTELKYFVQLLIDNLHENLLFQIGVNNEESAESLTFNLIEIKALFEILTKAHSDMKYAVLPQLPLELAIIEWGMRGVQVAQSPVNGDADDVEVSVSTLRKKVGNIKKNDAMYGTPKQNLPAKEPSARAAVELMNVPATGQVTKEWQDEFWRHIISEIKSYNHTIAGVLRGCSIGSFDKKTLSIETKYKFHKERLDDIKTKAELSRIAKLLTGKDIAVEVQLVDR